MNKYKFEIYEETISHYITNIQWSEQELLNGVNKYRLNSKEGEIKQKII